LAALDQTRDPVAARRYFAQAFRSDPNDWRTLMAYVRTFPPETLDANGLRVLERAWSLAPQVGDLAFMLARVYAEQNRLEEIANVLQAVAWSPHGGRRAELAQAMIDRARQGDRPGLLAAFQAPPPEAEAPEEPPAPPVAQLR
ncbi:MAG: hypothetical protein SNJ79_08070, partial [Sphingomonadaceae bacterium]